MSTRQLRYRSIYTLSKLHSCFVHALCNTRQFMLFLISSAICQHGVTLRHGGIKHAWPH